ncbi:ABC transporter ATP-binding protein [Ruminococcus sp. AF25-13]|jgi:ATP-binding cassette subfamily B multidrug efflux pump|uniref:ABC transporter ATP-binding protein n=1 Tax=Mediterraneibacter faecis TaxID=592978 RepID=UPI000E3FBE48|nr:ABC transporter ATP-binding protein [Mediterraneibacter faecis]RGD84850.1 ABC transporter ATP-binding protein [Ruminococcus sp. TF10-6]RGF29557.1 ABC transporter ATP-binding protein [Ruminococcus sp. AM09-18-1]RGF67981.1 ABC transporter ATP-binding protein [Ruminococcus sp. AF32-2AC]RGG04544.1 ABC transporter ATP-binding protein [Ruminococcus sp. AF27-3]RGG07384.1 ABC transporter ATP-binding protein [Ruminococcus sp. AF27-12AA]RGG11741.1 ABC transporter ATP-binding protein [Ruminococcus sp
MKTLLAYLKGYKKESILAPLFKMLEASFELFVPLVMAAIIDVGIANQDKPYIVKMCFVLIALGIIGLVCSITAQYFAAKAATGVGTGIRHGLFEHIQKFTFTEMDQLGTSTLITRMTSDINQIQSGVNLVLRLFLRSPFIVFGAMIMAFTVDVKAALVFVVTIPLLSLIVFGIMLVTMPMYKKVQADLDQVLLATRENLTGARVIRAFNKEEDETKRFENANQILTDAQKYVGRISGMMNPLTYIIVNGAIIALIYVGAVRVDIGDLTQGQVVALINYMSQILVELVKLANLIISVTKAAACLNRVESVLAVKPDMNEGDVRWKSNSSEADRDLKNKIPVVEFSHVSLTYKGTSDTSLSDINFCAEKGQTIGIIGGTGSGKSSLVNLIPRFYDATDGTVKINGRDIKEYQTENLREHIGVVLQKAVLFKGSIADNLRWGKEDATEQEMYEALDISQAREFVDTKQGGLEFQIEQGGRNLSGGQKQRMTIARALVRKPEILILDDSASALDFATDAALRKSIKEMKNQPTVFIVSQRAASIQYADQIIVLDDGAMAGIGTHEELLKDCPVYQEIYYSQFPKEAVING